MAGKRKTSGSEKAPRIDESVELAIDWDDDITDDLNDPDKIRAALVDEQAPNRDNEIAILDRINIDAINAEARKAAEQGFALYKMRKSSSVPFTQLIGDNMIALREKDYFTLGELGLLIDLMPYCEMHSNAIVNKHNGQFMTVTEIAKKLRRSLHNTSALINSLINKGAIYEFVSRAEIKKYGRPLSARPLFFNPEIVFAGNKNKINSTLCRLSMRHDPFEKSNIPLEHKVWLQRHEEFGKMYKRKTYLKLKKALPQSTEQD
ncbi:hypothetical protein CEB3_c21350 [Peptococcaceae bacterium CEB3]|nr:hypothetical protein CEB3_c21350 [Peptococcaceae bacterium CEB3]